jgi:hypothetical protein
MDMDNVVKFPGVETIELLEEAFGPSIEVSDVLTGLQDREFNDVVVLGTYSNKDNLYFASTSGDPAKILWDLERAKHVLMNLFMSTEDPLDNEV